MIGIVDYGVGNLYSLTCSLRHVGAQAVVSGEESVLRSASRVILPGVGAFGDAAEKLHGLGLEGLLLELAAKGMPLMGICLGMQLLFDRSYEYGQHKGLGLIQGEIRPLEAALAPPAKTPHMGWNQLAVEQGDDPLLQGIREGAFVYYVHSYYATGCDGALAASSDYGGVQIPGIVRRGNVCGAQFHPEKSGETGLAILKNFVGEDMAC